MNRFSWLASTVVALTGAALAGQAPLPTPQPPPSAQSAPQTVYASTELDRIVSPIALYPDPLLLHVLMAAASPADIPEAARWADDHHYLTGKALTDAVTAD